MAGLFDGLVHGHDDLLALLQVWHALQVLSQCLACQTPAICICFQALLPTRLSLIVELQQESD